jgi:hypothetical protein
MFRCSPPIPIIWACIKCLPHPTYSVNYSQLVFLSLSFGVLTGTCGNDGLCTLFQTMQLWVYSYHWYVAIRSIPNMWQIFPHNASRTNEYKKTLHTQKVWTNFILMFTLNREMANDCTHPSNVGHIPSPFFHSYKLPKDWKFCWTYDGNKLTGTYSSCQIIEMTTLVYT